MRGMLKMMLSFGLTILTLGAVSTAQAGFDLGYSTGYQGGYSPNYRGHEDGYGNGYGGGYGYNDVVRCESRDGRYRECRIYSNQGVHLVRQLSNAQCIEGRNWGFNGRAIWVDDGCRAEFVADAGYRGHRGRDQYRGGYGSDYGRGYGNGGWNNGYGGGGYGYGGGYGASGLVCESISNRFSHCPVNIGRGRVVLSYQLSNSACILGRTWGFDRSGIWVDRGCRAQFSIR